MAQLHATALGLNFSNVAAKVAFVLASAALVVGCATTPWSPGNAEARLADRSLIYLETNQFLWVDATQREQLACGNGTPVICTAGQSRLSLSHCGCLPDYD
jgi:hypothetical protein